MRAISFAMGAAFSVLAASAGIAAAEGDYATLKVVDTTVIELQAGLGDSAALLSPDGNLILYINPQEICLYRPAPIGLAEVACAPNPPDLRLKVVEDMFWSPKSDRLLAPTFREAFVALRDTDISVFDPMTFTMDTLTPDALDGGMVNETRTGNFDISPRWVDGDTIAFIRHEVLGPGLANWTGPQLMTIDIGDEPEAVTKPFGPRGVVVFALTVSADGQQFAYTIEDRDNPKNAGIYVQVVDGAERRQVATPTDLGRQSAGLAFSADGRFLLVHATSREGSLDARVIDLESGAITRVAADQNVVAAGWSPTGSALAYVIRDRSKPDAAGLFVAETPEGPGRLLLGGDFAPPVCCGLQPLIWAANDTLVLAHADRGGQSILYVVLGQ